MLLLTVVAPVLATNCYLVARGPNSDCLVVDPGIGADEAIETTLAEHGLRPVAALVTHGHADHTFGLAGLCRRRELPVYVHRDDRYRVEDPIGTVGPGLAPVLAGVADQWMTPRDLRSLDDGDEVAAAGIRVWVLHAPGHTEGASLYWIPDAELAGAGWCFTGDVLFAGTVGRTDLRGGDPETMARTLARLARAADSGLPDDTRLLPGHGPESTFGRERATNPFLLEYAEADR